MNNVKSLAQTSMQFLRTTQTALKGTVLEQLAKRMPENDAKYLMDRWKRLLPPTINNELPVASLSSPSSSSSTTSSMWGPTLSKVDITSMPTSVFSLPAPLTKSVMDVVETRNAVHNEAIFSEQKTLASTNDHAIFGKLVADVGYKKVYLSSVENLAKAQIWNKQRILRPERSLNIAQIKSNITSQPCFPGSIALFEDEATGECGVIDGQHRIAALIIMASNAKWDKAELNITVEVFKTSNNDNVKALYKGLV